MIGEFERPDLVAEQVAAGLRDVLHVSGRRRATSAPRPHRCSGSRIGDPAGEATVMQTGRPITADYRRLGFNISSRPRSVD